MNRHIKSFWFLPLAGMTLSFMPSCTTDSYGNSSVTPGGAAAIGVGALAAGVWGRWPPELLLGRLSSMTATRTGTAMTGATIILLLRLPVRLIAPNGGGKKGACV
ncbi:putative uncharacterized protein [Akkermansia muciniphila CAG:154]|nr:putative uncharacterized protein [Akkermansia muciniphila CAG:154]